VVRRGTVWKFRLTRGAKQEPVKAAAVWESPTNRPETNDNGLADLTLPSEAGNTTLTVWANVKNEPMVKVAVGWDQGFRPEAVANVKRATARDEPARFQLTDAAGRSATINGPVDPAVTAGRLVLSVSLADTAARATGTLIGTALDRDGRPVRDANVTIFYNFRQTGTVSDRNEHRVRTNAQGGYVLPSIPRQSHEGDPTKLSLVVYKDGYAGFDSPQFSFRPENDGAQVADTIRLQPGLSVSGIVVDPDGRPVAGALIWARNNWATGIRSYRSGADGRFTIPGLSKGVIPISFTFGKLTTGGKYVVDGKGDLTVQLRRAPDASPAAAVAKPEPAAPLEVGQLAPEWHVRGWTDGKSRSLADSRGKVVFLGFWGIWCGPCVKSLPVVERLRGKYEPRGVDFAEIHTPGDTLANIRKLFALENIPSISALDEGNDDDVGGGTTARAYGVCGYPTAILIDRTGKIAFRSDDPDYRSVLAVLSKKCSDKLGISLDSALTDEQSEQLRAAVLGEVIEKVLAQQ
jgi:thiol-disulfide isomerase/thioredoxin